MPCSFVGLGGLQKAAVDEDHEEVAKGGSQLFRAFGVGLPRILLELLLQPSLFALTFANTESAGRCKQLLSLAVSQAMALKAAVEVAMTIMKNWKEMLSRVEGSTCSLVCFGFLAVFVVGIPGTMGVGMLRVFCAYQCEDHVWNLFTGCVEL